LSERRPDVVLLDRDGTINVKASEGEYITHPEQVRLLDGAGEAIRRLNQAGVPVAVVTNQRGLALGRMTEDDLAAVHRRLEELLAANGAHVAAIFHCPHDEGSCACRKPGTLLLERARNLLRLETLENSVMIGDSCTDVAAGRAVGARSVLLAAAADADRHVRAGDVAPSLLDAVKRIMGT
jgi:D-glycero-D-manno-heptose 1,7-bisphosphate phosphatase